ncbi:hypothetical protein V6N13_117931 [Hibiscus sabdariffa]
MIAFFINPAKQIIFTNVIIVSVVNIRDESPNSIISFVYLMQNFCFETFAVTTNVVSEFGSNNFTLVSMKAKRPSRSFPPSQLSLVHSRSFSSSSFKVNRVYNLLVLSWVFFC